MSRAWTVFWPAVIALVITGGWLAQRPSGAFFDISIVVAPLVFAISFGLLWLPAILVQLFLIDRSGARSFRSVTLWIAVVCFVPATWIVVRGRSTALRDRKAEAQRAAERESIHRAVGAANDISVVSEPLSGPAEDEVISFVSNRAMSAGAQLAAAAHFGHSPRLLYALAMRHDVPAEALSTMYDSSLTVSAARDTSLTRRSCLDTVELNDLCRLWGRLASVASPALLQKMLNGPNAVIRGAAEERRARDDSAMARSR